MVCAGFVPELTAKAAENAALGAGAKVTRCYSYKLTSREVAEIEAATPDIVLLSGGTDGGDEKVIIHNAEMLAKTGRDVSSIIVAGNKSTYDNIRKIFNGTSKQVVYTDNVMPEIGVLNVTSCNREIRALFMKNIVEAKGIAAARSIIKDVIMPTPSAVLEAAKLIAGGYAESEGLGEIIVIDVGGATTDVHSVCSGNPTREGVVLQGEHVERHGNEHVSL